MTADLFAAEPKPSVQGAKCTKCGRFTSDNTKDEPWRGEADEHTFSGTCGQHGRIEVWWGEL